MPGATVEPAPGATVEPGVRRGRTGPPVPRSARPAVSRVGLRKLTRVSPARHPGAPVPLISAAPLTPPLTSPLTSAPGAPGSPMSLAESSRLAVRVAQSAAVALLELRLTAGREDAGALRARADATAHQVIADALAGAAPDVALLSEEAPDDPARLSARQVWIVDPLDGTREYGEVGREDWAVHIALWDAAADDLVLGVVALPARGVVYSSTAPRPVPARAGGRWRVAVSRSRPPAVALGVAAALDADLVPLGSAGYKIAAVVAGEVDAYVHAGGQYQWDSAAPVAVARAVGLHASRLDGGPLRYNSAELYLPDLLVCRPELADPILRAVAGAGPGPPGTRPDSRAGPR